MKRFLFALIVSLGLVSNVKADGCAPVGSSFSFQSSYSSFGVAPTFVPSFVPYAQRQVFFTPTNRVFVPSSTVIIQQRGLLNRRSNSIIVPGNRGLFFQQQRGLFGRRTVLGFGF